jgi:two-component system CheB/CheR fusion protein
MSEPAHDSGFERIIDHLRARSFDFTAYKAASLMRRLRKRMRIVGVDDFDLYLEYLQLHPEEFAALFNTILINVTAFWRDPDVWETLRTNVLPETTVLKHAGPIRVWSAGCASGQEAYSAAMVLAEILGADGFRERVRIYATDIDEETLAEGRRAAYHENQVQGVPADLREKYFDRNGSKVYSVVRELRRAVIFRRHDLIQDAPISRVDLLLCRNTLMYFNSEAQARIMARFNFSVNPGGHLVLGRAEMLFGAAARFTPIDLKRRIFTTTPE